MGLEQSEDFIMIIDDVFSNRWIDDIIKYYNHLEKSGICHARKPKEPSSLGEPSFRVNDSSIFLQGHDHARISGLNNVSKEFLDVFWSKIYGPYNHKYDILETADKHFVRSMKIQKTKPGQGYHIWHFEQGGLSTSGRIITFITYLNDVEDGGETEFLYFPKRIKPKKGRTVIFPGAYTHAHRGNQPLSGDKYIITGWIDY